MDDHVGIPDRESGIRALNGLRRWSPVLTALSANSPLWRGAESGFASRRSIHYRRWVVFGIPPHSENLDDYDAQVGAALRSDVVIDERPLGWLVRLSPSHTTVEVRACDVPLDTEATLTLALLIRAFADVAMDDPVTGLCRLLRWGNRSEDQRREVARNGVGACWNSHHAEAHIDIPRPFRLVLE